MDPCLQICYCNLVKKKLRQFGYTVIFKVNVFKYGKFCDLHSVLPALLHANTQTHKKKYPHAPSVTLIRVKIIFNGEGSFLWQVKVERKGTSLF